MAAYLPVLAVLAAGALVAGAAVDERGAGRTGQRRLRRDRTAGDHHVGRLISRPDDEQPSCYCGSSG